MRPFRSFSAGVLSAYALLVLAPIATFFLVALWDGLAPETWAELGRQMVRKSLLLNSLVLSTLTALGSALLGVPLGFLLARTDVACRRVLLGLCAAPLFLPPFLWATAWQAGLQTHGLSGMGGAVLVLVLALFPLVVLLAAVGFAQVDPALEEEARLCGSEGQVFWHATLPLARPLLATGLVMVFLLALAEFGVPALMQVEVYPVAIYAAFSASYDFAQAAALCLPLAGIAAGMAFLLQRLAYRVDFASLAVQHWAPRRVGLGSGRLAATLAAFTLFALVLGLPLGTLALKAGDFHAWSGAAGPMLWSLGLSALSASLLVLLGLLVAWPCQRGYVRGGVWWVQGQTLLFVLPGAVVGLGLVALWNRPWLGWFYGTPAMIVLGEVARFAPLMVGAFAAFLAQVPKDGEEAIWLDGGGVVATFAHFVFPVTRRALGVLWAMGFVLCMGELATAILVAPPGMQTLAVRLFTIEANAPQAHTASLALILVVSCLAPLGLLLILLKKESIQ
ncbi:MAG: iron ABC transporter permease [Candidatus Latescibacteria bacterium]|nr:iron ABC transporter permease [Candidatus Latescibacterota bacterium]